MEQHYKLKEDFCGFQKGDLLTYNKNVKGYNRWHDSRDKFIHEDIIKKLPELLDTTFIKDNEDAMLTEINLDKETVMKVLKYIYVNPDEEYSNFVVNYKPKE